LPDSGIWDRQRFSDEKTLKILENVFQENVFQNIIEKPNFVKRFDGEATEGKEFIRIFHSLSLFLTKILDRTARKCVPLRFPESSATLDWNEI
jgi:hypothetical protein